MKRTVGWIAAINVSWGGVQSRSDAGRAGGRPLFRVDGRVAVRLTVESSYALPLEGRQQLGIERRGERVVHQRVLRREAPDGLDGAGVDTAAGDVEVVTDVEAQHLAEHD